MVLQPAQTKLLSSVAKNGARYWKDAKPTRNANAPKPLSNLFLRGKDIRSYYYEWAGLWLIFIPWHFPLHEDLSVQGACEKAKMEFVKQYPSVYQHLLNFKTSLSKRNKEETAIRYEWYALQRCAATYYPRLRMKKGFWQELAQASQFSLDERRNFLLQTLVTF
ncbi:hypothetical protein EM20IM_00895 [Candidatus Methylacidiphilum infernorum]|uniref:Uncharacterized protein n=1 Tax=Candidatus Methylacidiphilum infernorum TaxID=511746 RepID=A0ABX7PWB1_9BACT|nr:hypothetical protein [Candidatus Methylacidiphilum infernorum]QSR86963.1 hypothetical protein EM20IM_00895 [Candidatus Methylacidiphilum infernorum]